jgi:hypothetical protein
MFEARGPSKQVDPPFTVSAVKQFGDSLCNDFGIKKVSYNEPRAYLAQLRDEI